MRVVVLGGGPAGMSAALHARELGAEVTLLEARRSEARVSTTAQRRCGRWLVPRGCCATPNRGIGSDSTAPFLQLDIVAALASARRVADYVHDQQRLADALRRRGIELVDEAGPSVFVDSHTVRIPDGREYRGDAIVVAVGGRPGSLPIPGAELALTYEHLRQISVLPRSVVVVGGADTGCQLASILADFGVEVALIEAAPRLVGKSDEDVSEALARSFHGRGIAVLTSTLVERLERRSGGITVHHRSETGVAQIDADAVFFAVGWPGNADRSMPAGSESRSTVGT